MWLLEAFRCNRLGRRATRPQCGSFLDFSTARSPAACDPGCFYGCQARLLACVINAKNNPAFSNRVQEAGVQLYALLQSRAAVRGAR